MEKRSDYAWVDGKPVKFYDCSDELYDTRQDDMFHVGQVYEEEAAETVYCKKCKGTEFNVGQGSWLTVIRCPTCGWEEQIHSG